jgi:rod shape determining protein RodA
MSYPSYLNRAGWLEYFNDMHKPLFICVGLLGLIGVMVLYSVAGGDFSPWAWRHGIRIIGGLGLIYALSTVELRTFYVLAYPLFGLVFILLVGVEILGSKNMGAQRWLDLGFVRLQPSEFMRLALVLALARFYHGMNQNDVSHPLNLIAPLAMIAAPCLLVLNQPDLGTSIMIAVTGLSVVFLAGVNLRYFMAGTVAIIAAIPVVWQNMLTYQKERVLVFLNPERDPLGAGYHIIQSKIGIGSGGVFGKGLAQGTQSQLNFLPERHTDFIFSNFAEEMGFTGSLALLVLFILTLFFIFRIANQMRYPFSRLAVASMGFSISIYVIVNLAMVMGLAPVVGVPLPFVSYGGTSLLTFMASIGVILAMERQTTADLPK